MEGPNEIEIRGPEETAGIKVPAENAETRDPGENERIRGPEETEQIKGVKETEIRDREGSEETRGPETTEGLRGSEETEETRVPEETEGLRGSEDTEKIRGSEGTEEIRDPEKTEENPRGPEETEGLRGSKDTEKIGGSEETEIRDPEKTEENSRGPEETEGIRGPAENVETRGPGENERTRVPEETEQIEGPKETEIRSEETRGLEETEKIRGPEETKGIMGPEETEETRGPGETRTPKENEFRGPEESKETGCSGETWSLKETEVRGPEESEGIRGPGDTEDNREPEHNETKSLGETEGIRGPGETWSPEEAENVGQEESEETRSPGETRIPKETEVRGPEEPEGTRDLEESKETRTPKETEVKGPEESEGTGDPGESKETRGLGETRTPKDTEVRGPEEPEGTRDPGESKETRGSEETRTPKETEVRGPEEPEGTRDPVGYKETKTPDKSKEIRTSGERKQKVSVRFEIGEIEETEKIRTPDSSQDTREPKETGSPEISKKPRDLGEVKAMAEKGCLSLTKYFLFVFNIFFFVLGSLVFCFGLWILIDKNSFASYLGLSFIPLKAWSYVLTIAGVLTGLLSLLGCLGALKEIRCLLGLYFSFLLLLFTTQITIGVLIYTQQGLLERKVKDIVLDVIENYHKYPDAYSTAENWDFVQFQLRCCGWTSPQDWLLASSLRPNGSAPSGSGRAITSSPTQSSDFLPSSQTSGPVLRVPCSCQNTSVIMSTPQSPADAPRASQPAAGPGARATVVSNPGMPVVLLGSGSPGTPARLRSGELCSMPADNGAYQEGCSRSIYTWLHNNLISIVGVSLGLGLLEVVAVGLTVVLLPHARAWGSRCQGLEGESSAARWGGNCGSGTPWSKWGMACKCTSWGSQAPNRLPSVVERWLPRQHQASRPSTVWSTCRLEPQGCE